LIDQHAAHERVAFEELMQAWKARNIPVQDFLLPLPLTFSGERLEALMSAAPDLETVGLTLEQLGPETVAVRSAPDILKESAIERALRWLADEMVESGGSFALEKVVGELFATMACHSVVRAGQALSLQEMTSLLRQMDRFAWSSFCPHGRPVFVEYSFQQLERDFGRRS
jgi:DNA mismatch repair protein MutL